MNPSIDALKTHAFWHGLCPYMSINESSIFDDSKSVSAAKLDPRQWAICQQTINQDGYFVYESWLDIDWMDRLAGCFRALAEIELPPIFAFVYDDFWQILLSIRPIFDDLLGDYDFLPAVWGWHVRPDSQTAFAPHRDQVREVFIDDEDHLDYLTVWVPLTDLNHLSSSICVLPASLDPDYEDATVDIRVENLQDVRCLQGRRGSVFCWTTQLAHWGTTQSQHGEPRMSVGYYLKRASAASMDDGPPIDFSQPLTLRDRLSIIGQQILDYSRTAGEAELQLANQLVQLSGR